MRGRVKSLYSIAGSMSSAAKVTVAFNYLVGVVTTEVLLQLLVVLPPPVALLVPLFLPLQLCTSFPSPLVVCLGVVPTASEAGARPFELGCCPVAL
jgi:hypothetical protein